VAVRLRRRARIEVAEQLRGLGLAQRRERESLCVRRRERGGQEPGGAPGPERDREQDRRGRAAAQQCRQQLGRRDVAPVQVVEDEHERPGCREELQQRAHRAVRAVALVGDRTLTGGPGAPQRGEDPGELADQCGVPGRVELVVQGGDVGVERVRPHAERHLALELRRRPSEHEAAPVLGAPAQLGEQPRLADPGLALQGHAGRHPVIQRIQRRPEPLELGIAPDGRPGAGVAEHRGATLLRFRDPVQGASSMFRGARTPSVAACNLHATSQRGPDAGAPSTARPRSSDGSPSSSWPSWPAARSARRR
jgi:hypothetical protein